MNKFQQWAQKRKPPPPPKPTVEVEVEADELTDAWEEWKEAHKTPILLFKVALGCIFLVVFTWAIAVVDIQNECWLSKECREWRGK